MKKYLKILAFFFAISFGIFMFIYGGYDDSPGGQGLGLLLFILGVVGFIKNKKNLTN